MRLAPILATAAAATALTLAGCSASPATPTVDVPKAAETAAAAAPTTAAPARNMSPRGNIVKQIGEAGGWGANVTASTDPATLPVKFVVDKITVDPKCTQRYASAPEHGHFVQLDVRIETSPQMTMADGATMSAGDFSTVGADGVTESSLLSGGAFSCLDNSAYLPSSFSPGAKYRGSIVLDTANPAGTLIFRPGFVDGGWEWTYPTA